MNKYRRYLPIIAMVMVGLGALLERNGIDLDALTRGESPFSNQTANSSSPNNSNSASNSRSSGSQHSGQKWSDTSPEINMHHVFDGEINRKNRPTGFHSRPNGQDPANARLVRIKDKPNRYGVYTADIEVNDGGEWKRKFSSFFPDELSHDEVIEVILHAYNNSDNKNGTPWEGPSGAGYRVQGYTTRQGGINTAFPIYTR